MERKRLPPLSRLLSGLPGLPGLPGQLDDISYLSLSRPESQSQSRLDTYTNNTRENKYHMQHMHTNPPLKSSTNATNSNNSTNSTNREYIVEDADTVNRNSMMMGPIVFTKPLYTKATMAKKKNENESWTQCFQSTNFYPTQLISTTPWATFWRACDRSSTESDSESETEEKRSQFHFLPEINRKKFKSSPTSPTGCDFTIKRYFISKLEDSDLPFNDAFYLRTLKDVLLNHSPIVPKLLDTYGCEHHNYFNLVLSRLDQDMMQLGRQQFESNLILSNLFSDFPNQIERLLFTENQIQRMFHIANLLSELQLIHGNLQLNCFSIDGGGDNNIVLNDCAFMGQAWTPGNIGFVGTPRPSTIRPRIGWPSEPGDNGFGYDCNMNLKTLLPDEAQWMRIDKGNKYLREYMFDQMSIRRYYNSFILSEYILKFTSTWIDNNKGTRMIQPFYGFKFDHYDNGQRFYPNFKKFCPGYNNKVYKEQQRMIDLDVATIEPKLFEMNGIDLEPFIIKHKK